MITDIEQITMITIFTRQTYLSNHHRSLDKTKEEIKTIPGKRNLRILF